MIIKRNVSDVQQEVYDILPINGISSFTTITFKRS